MGLAALVGEIKEEGTAAGRHRGTFADKRSEAQRSTHRPPPPVNSWSVARARQPPWIRTVNPCITRC